MSRVYVCLSPRGRRADWTWCYIELGDGSAVSLDTDGTHMPHDPVWAQALLSRFDRGDEPGWERLP